MGGVKWIIYVCSLFWLLNLDFLNLGLLLLLIKSFKFRFRLIVNNRFRDDFFLYIGILHLIRLKFVSRLDRLILEGLLFLYT